MIFFFFSSRRRHTRLQGDWSSDVCSSDLPRHRQPSRRLPGGPRPERCRGSTQRGDRRDDRRIGRIGEVSGAQGPHGTARAASPSPGPTRMTCREAIAKLAEYLDAELTPEVLQEIDAHLEICAPCRAYVATYRKTTELVAKVLRVELPE